MLGNCLAGEFCGGRDIDLSDAVDTGGFSVSRDVLLIITADDPGNR